MKRFKESTVQLRKKTPRGKNRSTADVFDTDLLITMLEKAPVIIGFHDRNNNILWANKAYLKATGLSLQKLKGKKCYEVWKHEKLCHHCPIVMAIETGKPQEAELTPQNQPHWPITQRSWMAKAMPVKDKKGNVIGAIEATFDITEQKKIEMQREQLLRDLGGRTKELDCLYGLSKIVEKPGVSLDGIFQGLVKIIPSAWQYPEITCAKIIFQGKEFKTEDCKPSKWTQSADIKVHGKKAGTINVIYIKEKPRVNEGPFSKEERELLNALAEQLGRIVERKEMEKTIRDEHKKLMSILDSMNDGVYLVNQDYNIQYANPALKKEFGEIKKRKCYEYFHDRKEVCPWCKNPEVFRGKTVHWEWYFSKNHRTYDLMDTPLENLDGSISKLAIFRDITDRKKAEKAIKETAEIKSRFASIASHELRNPISSIKEGISTVLEGLAGDLTEKQKEFLGIVKVNADRLASLANDLLDFQKFADGRMQLKIAKNDINRTIKDTYDTLHLLAEQKGLYCILELDKKLPRINFDEDKIKQVLANLITNAIKFTEEGGIKISTYKGNNIVHVEVQDTGTGIKKQDLPKLFQIFTQLKTPTRTVEKGTGLGLAICKEIIDAHEGRIWAESEFNKGATFHFILPIRERRH